MMNRWWTDELVWSAKDYHRLPQTATDWLVVPHWTLKPISGGLDHTYIPDSTNYKSTASGAKNPRSQLCRWTWKGGLENIIPVDLSRKPVQRCIDSKYDGKDYHNWKENTRWQSFWALLPRPRSSRSFWKVFKNKKFEWVKMRGNYPSTVVWSCLTMSFSSAASPSIFSSFGSVNEN